MNKLSLIITIICILPFYSHAQKADQYDRDQSVFGQYGKHALKDAGQYFTSPIRWSGKDWLIFGGVGAATTSLILWGDEPIDDGLNSIRTDRGTAAFRWIEPIGQWYGYATGAAVLTSLHGVVTKNEYSVETGMIAIQSALFSAITTRALKMTFNRARPYKELGPHEFFNTESKNHSFPSGHTTWAFSIASVFSYRYKETKWVPFVSYGLAALGGFERMYDRKHWTSDVLLGATIGTVTGLFLCKSYEIDGLDIYPIANKDMSGLYCKYSF